MSTIAELILYPLNYQASKHELGAEWVEAEVESWSNMELINQISRAMERKEAGE